MTKQRILITGNPSLFVIHALLQKCIEGEIEVAFDRLEVDISEYKIKTIANHDYPWYHQCSFR